MEATETPPGRGRKVRLMTLNCLDGRTAAARAAERLLETYRRDRGGKFSRRAR